MDLLLHTFPFIVSSLLSAFDLCLCLKDEASGRTSKHVSSCADGFIELSPVSQSSRSSIGACGQKAMVGELSEYASNIQ